MPGITLKPIQSFENIVYIGREALWGDPAEGKLESIQTLTFSYSVIPSGGTFKLTVSGTETATIPWNGTAAQVKAALEAALLTALGQAVTVDVTGGPAPTAAAPFTVVFRGRLGAAVLVMTSDITGLTGGTDPVLTHAVTQAGVATPYPLFALRTQEIQTTPHNESVSFAGEHIGGRGIYTQPSVPGREYSDGTIPTYLYSDTGMLLWLLVMGSMYSESEDPAGQAALSAAQPFKRYKHVIRCASRPGSLTIKDFRGGRTDNVQVTHDFYGCDLTTARLSYDGDQDNGAIRADYSFLGTFPFLRGRYVTDEVQTVTITGTPTGGTFTLSHATKTTEPIPYNANAGQVQTALEDILESADGAGIGSVFVTGGPAPATAFRVYFVGRRGITNQDVLTGSAAALTGGTPALVFATVVAGGATKYAASPTVNRGFASWQPVSTITLPTRFGAVGIQETRLINFNLTFDNGVGRVKAAVGQRNDQGHTFGGRAVTGTITRFMGPPQDEQAIVATPALNDTEIFRELNRTKEEIILSIEAAGNTIVNAGGVGSQRRDRTKWYMTKMCINGDPERIDHNGSVAEVIPFIAYEDTDGLGGPIETTFWNQLESAAVSSTNPGY